MKTRLLFLISRFLDGGIDTILTEYLRNIPLDRYDVTLAIGTAMGDLEVHRSRLPEGVRVEYLVDATALTHWRKEKIRRRIPAAAKIYDELILNPIRTAVAHRRLKRLISQADAVIDFDATFYTMLRSCRVPVIGFYHFSIEENLRRSRRHTLRQMHGMANYVHIALISNVMVEEGKRLFPELASRFTRIYNGYNFADLRRRGEAETVVEVRKPYFVAVERLEESQKDVSTLLRAYAKARTESDGPFPGLVVVGADATKLCCTISPPIFISKMPPSSLDSRAMQPHIYHVPKHLCSPRNTRVSGWCSSRPWCSDVRWWHPTAHRAGRGARRGARRYPRACWRRRRAGFDTFAVGG